MEAALSSRERCGLASLAEDRCETVVGNGRIARAFRGAARRPGKPVPYQPRFVVPQPPIANSTELSGRFQL